NIPEKQTIFIKKNRINTTRETSFMMYDLFLHVVDTAVYLAEGPLHVVQSKLVEENGHLKRAILQLETEQTTIVCSMDLHSGANTETFEVTSPTGTYRLENLTHLTIQTEEEYQVKEMGDWTPTLEKRGFYQMVTAFIQAIQKPQEQELKQEKVYESHALCEEMLRQQQRHVL
ncbi:gfo/Idh/MocA family oxidoreductase, partial [Enterococcus faecalis]|nr:gfo/Idh/MocA family oxidoreductase [Enterococcus faecalis]